MYGDGLKGMGPGRMRQGHRVERTDREDKFRTSSLVTDVRGNWEGAGKDEPQASVSSKTRRPGGLGGWVHIGPSHQERASRGCHQRAEKCFLWTFSREGARARLLGDKTWDPRAQAGPCIYNTARLPIPLLG